MQIQLPDAVGSFALAKINSSNKNAYVADGNYIVTIAFTYISLFSTLFDLPSGFSTKPFMLFILIPPIKVNPT